MQLCDLRMQISRAQWTILASLVIVTSLASTRAVAQAEFTRTRAAEFSGFGMYTLLTPDYGSALNNGYSVGGDFTKFFKFTALSLEFRFKDTYGPTVGERTTGGGPRFEYRLKRVHLYGDFLVSTGKITFANKNDYGSFGKGYNGSVVLTYGGGLDYDLSPQWSLRFDLQGEHWDLHETPDILLSPTAWSVGIMGRVRLPKRKSQSGSSWKADLRSASLKR